VEIFKYPKINILFFLIIAQLFITIKLANADTCEAYDKYISPGNGIQLTVFPDTSGFPNGIYQINDHGCVQFPIIGEVNVKTISLIELQEIVKKAYTPYLNYPNIEIKPVIRVSLLGGFYQPGLYWVEPTASLWDLVKLGGGTIREDGVNKIKWIRESKQLSQNIPMLYQSGQSLATIGFKSGDQIRVTTRPKETFGDIFLTRILPILSFTLTTVTSAATTYLLFND